MHCEIANGDASLQWSLLATIILKLSLHHADWMLLDRPVQY